MSHLASGLPGQLPGWVYREMLTVLDMAVSVADLQADDTPLIFVNPAFEKLTGYATRNVLGRNGRFLQGAATSLAVRRRIRHAVDHRHPTRARLLNYRADGSVFWNDFSLVPLSSPSGEVDYLVGLHRDVTADVEREKVLLAAGRDDLTSLPTRRALHDALADAIGQAVTGGHALAVLFVDLDGFKAINDQLGHVAGDKALVAVARSLEKSIRPGDLVARYGGDEFIVLLERLEPQTARTVAQRLCDELSQALIHTIDGIDGAITASVGLAIYPADGDTADKLIHAADTLMYQYKRRRSSPRN